MRVLHYYYEYGKAEALKEFDIVINRIIEMNGMDALYKVSFLSGLLYPNGVVTKEESDELSNKYAIAVMETEVPNYGEIRRLHDSLNSGVITQEEFEVKKKELLGT